MKMGTPIAGLLLGIAAASWGAQAKATPIEFDMVFFGDDFAQISEFDGGFVYDDTNGFVSNFFVDLDSYGSFFLPDAVPASALHLGSPPSIAFDSNIVVDLEGGLTASVSLFNTTNVFGIFQDNGTFDTLLREGFYQILPASVVSVPEPPSLALIAAGILLLLLMGARRKQRSS